MEKIGKKLFIALDQEISVGLKKKHSWKLWGGMRQIAKDWCVRLGLGLSKRLDIE